ncbi:MAG: hypothetical protein KDA20_01740 [Phycisphaerales bacterium]|nr:hypothetical protein [Phycisphaerales bacterium]
MTASAIAEFNWEPQPAAQELLTEIVTEFFARCKAARTLGDKMRIDTGTRFMDWLDFIQLPRSQDIRDRLTKVGFTRKAVDGAPDCYVHEGAIFPMVILDAGKETAIGIKVDSVVEFLAAWQITDQVEIVGDPLTPMRRACAFKEGDAELWVIERHGCRSFGPIESSAIDRVAIVRHREAFRRRTRDWDDNDVGFDHTQALIRAAVEDLGEDVTCAIFFEAERHYWMSKNRAARVQYSRQNAIGLGWANHDHHTYRSSRPAFIRLLQTLAMLGMQPRERFYAGHEAGWGAQVLEQPVAGITVFADVDLSAEELATDFWTQALPARTTPGSLGTVGMWVGLHGESALEAGMHHLECQFDHDALVGQLQAASVMTMSPFTNFPFLKQAFTEGERWNVAEKRIERLLEKNLITQQQANQFRMQGAIGSHLENLERNDGYKGFNQQGVSDIIERTSPMRQLVGA